MIRYKFLFLVLSLMTILPLAYSDDLVIGGSDLLGAAFREALGEELLKRGLEPQWSLEGSLRGLKALEDGSLEVALLALPDGSELPMGYRRILIACKIAVLAVHRDNPLRVLSLGQLGGIFLPEGPIENWSDLTESMDWYGRKIELVAIRGEEGMNLQLFSSFVLGGEGFRPEVRILETGEEGFTQAIASAPNTLVLAPGFREQAPLRFLAVKAFEASEAYSPTQDNVYFGDYPLRLPFYLVCRNTFDPGKVDRILESLFSGPVSSALEDARFVTVPLQERRSLLSQD